MQVLSILDYAEMQLFPLWQRKRDISRFKDDLSRLPCLCSTYRERAVLQFSLFGGLLVSMLRTAVRLGRRRVG